MGLRRETGTTWISINSEPIFESDSPTPEYVLTSFADFTSRIEAELLQRRLYQELEVLVEQRTNELRRTIGELESFNYSVSHDLRSPLRAIDGYSYMILNDSESGLSASAKENLEFIRQAAGRMSNLIDDLLRLSRLSFRSLQVQNVDITKLVQEKFQQLRTQEPDVMAELSVEPGLAVRGDESLMEIVIDNLIDNAWKYSSLTPVRSISVAGSNGEIAIVDNGSGFDMRYVEKVFEPFERLHSGEEFRGSGIGLSIVKRIVERHGGTVSIESEVGKGTKVMISMEPEALQAR
jgi:signal transduction histidine kinase